MKKSSFPVFGLLLASPFLLNAAPLAQVAAEDPDGAMYQRDGSFELAPGTSLMAGDRISSGSSTVVLAFSNGSRLTVLPDTSLEIIGATAGSVDLKLMSGEILGDASGVSTFTVMTKAGSTMASGGVFGIVQSQTGGDNWSLQVRNLDADVQFVGDLSLDVGDLTVSLLEPGKSVSVPAGEEIIVRGVYSETEEIFTLVEDGGALAVLDTGTVAEIREASEQMSSAEVPGTGPVAGEAPSPLESTVIIEIPFEDVETASDKG